MRRYHYVDLLRGLAALAVVVGHYRYFYYNGGTHWRQHAILPLYPLLHPLYDGAGFSVRLFWVLSGFVFVVAYGAADVSARTFWVHRFSRLYPLHLLTLLIVAALQLLSLRLYGHWTIEPNNDVRHFLLQLAMASNWFTIERSFNSPIWSVSIEVLIYFVFLVYLKRFGVSISVAIALMVLGGAAALMLHGFVIFLVQCLSLFFAGVVIAILSRKVPNLLPLSVLGVATVFALGMALHWLGMEHRAYLAAVYLGCPAVLTLFVALERYHLPERWHWIGLSTYSVYLWHMPLLIAIKIACGSRIPAFLPSPIFLVAWVATVAAIGVLSYRHFEAPMQHWIRSHARGSGVEHASALTGAQT